MSAEKSGLGRVIAVDGPDGAGKSTQVDLLVEYFEKQGRTVHKTRTSGGTVIGEELRQVSLNPELPRSGRTDMFISQAMSQALSEDIAPRKAKGEIVVIDRSPLAIVAYNGYGSQMENKDETLQVCIDTAALLQIDQLIYLTAAQHILDERRKKRGKNDFFERMGPEYHLRVREGYEAGLEHLRKADLELAVFEIDAAPKEPIVHQNILNAIE
jgi:dTMP kinase